MEIDSDVAVIGAGVVGCATALALARRGASVVLLEAEAEPGLAASGTNSGILHTGFDSSPGELETQLILRSAQLRDPVLEALGLPVLRCGARLRPIAPGDANVFDGAIDKIEFLGSYCLVRVNAEAMGSEPITVYLSLNYLAEQGLEVGSRLPLKVLPERMRFF